MVKVSDEHIKAMCEMWSKPIEVLDDGTAKPENQPLSVLNQTSGIGEAMMKEPLTKKPRIFRSDAEQIRLTRVALIENPLYAPPPGIDYTGVSEDITEICASLSSQIYTAESKDYFRFRQDGVRVLLLDTHDDLDAAVPAFALASYQDTLILCWRGTSNPLDVITDGAISPVSSSRLPKLVRAHGMFSALVESDLALHRHFITKQLVGSSTKQIICTGHSLGGAIASVAHVHIQALLDNASKGTPWDSQATCRSLTFAAPMSMLDVDEVVVANASDPNTEADERSANDLLSKVAKNSCNFVYQCDVVPRGYSNLEYIYHVVEGVARDVTPWAFQWAAYWALRRAQMAFGSNPVIKVAVKYRHAGTILYYGLSDAQEPKVLYDEGPGSKKGLDQFTYQEYNIPRKWVVETLLDAHSFFPRKFAKFVSPPEMNNGK